MAIEDTNYKYRKERGDEDYTSLVGLLREDVVMLSEDDSYYYIRLRLTEFYDNGMYKVSKRTGEVGFMHYTQYMLDCMDNAKEINPEVLRRAIA